MLVLAMSFNLPLADNSDNSLISSTEYAGITANIKITKAAQTIKGVRSQYTVNSDSRLTLKAKASGKLSYTSSDKTIATVDKNGVVTTKMTGRVVITINAEKTSTKKAATKTVVIYVLPRKGNIKKLFSSQDEHFTVIICKQSECSGYEIQYYRKKTLKKSNILHLNGNDNVKKTVQLNKGKRYYVCVRAYKITSEVTIYGPWSSTKSVKIK